MFKSFELHQKCWGLLDVCNANVSYCPIDIITFHRKGVNSSSDILTETIDLMKEFHNFYPNLSTIPVANSEGDPTSGWSKNVTSYTDVHYAQTLISIVFEHWNAFLLGFLRRFESISHDNSFLSYHPFEFTQRTMLARFMMNNTHPKSVIFIQKPVYSALGMLSALASTATKFYTHKNINYILSLEKNYASILLLSTEQNHFIVNITMNVQWNCIAYFAEFIDQEQTNPYSIWLKYNRPPYPNDTALLEMKHAQVIHSIIA